MNQKLRLSLFAGVGAAIVAALSLPLFADDDFYRPVKDPLVAAECSECHMLFPVGLLPASSWREMMRGLNTHFGVNASLEPADTALVQAYLTKNAGQESKLRQLYNAAIGFVTGTESGPVNIRVTALSWFKEEHGPKILSVANMAKKKAKSAASCKACHPAAEQGNFDD